VNSGNAIFFSPVMPPRSVLGFSRYGFPEDKFQRKPKHKKPPGAVLESGPRDPRVNLIIWYIRAEALEGKGGFLDIDPEVS
jgi:hypothetical protein